MVDYGSVGTRQEDHLFAFQESPNLYSMDLNGLLSWKAQDIKTMVRCLEKILLTCPNLRHLMLDFASRWGNLSLGIFDKDLSNMCYGRLPALKTLKVIQHSLTFFNRYREVSTGFFVDISRDNKQHYLSMEFDWSQLKRLCIHDAAVLSQVAKFTSLKEVDFTDFASSSYSAEFLRQVPTTLESIKIYKLNVSDLDAILKHGSGLRILHVAGAPYLWERDEIWHTNVETLQQIRNGCPKIEELALYCAWDHTWPDNILNILVEFRRLRSLKLYFKLFRDDADFCNLPLTFLSISELFASFHNRSQSQSSLRQLNVVSSVYSRILRPDTRPHELLIDDCDLVCELSERDDEAARGAFTVTCLNIGENENLILRRALEASVDPISLFEKPQKGIKLKKASASFKFGTVVFWTVLGGDDWIIENEDDYRELRQALPEEDIPDFNDWLRDNQLPTIPRSHK
ncbi:hypothetical protein K449DRAFT_436414 [Hypoxylon sp. EC38]|nr:hypothetical protein K449DRAFT_436414 [Hypoxylon sp. EC38]